MLAKVDEKVRELVADVLGLQDDLEEVRLESDIVDDLAGESIDFVDIAFQIEQEIGLPKVSPEKVFPVGLIEEELFAADGSMRVEVESELREKYPHIPDETLKELRSTANKRVLFRVAVLRDFVVHQLGMKSE